MELQQLALDLIQKTVVSLPDQKETTNEDVVHQQTFVTHQVVISVKELDVTLKISVQQMTSIHSLK